MMATTVKPNEYWLIDWLPTFMGRASNGEWTGSLTDATLDGYDMWDAIMTNSPSPRHEIVHYADGKNTITLQSDDAKIIFGIITPAFTSPPTKFQTDLFPNNSYMKCMAPSLVYAASILADDDDHATTDDHGANPRDHQSSILVVIFQGLFKIVSILIIAFASLAATISLILALHTCKCMIEERYFPDLKKKSRKADKLIFQADAVISRSSDSKVDFPMQSPSIDPEYSIPEPDSSREQYTPIEDASEETRLLVSNV